jgi:gamma-glutamyl AIG2-like cyclotransferase
MGGLTDHVFGYGSLVADLRGAVPATLSGYRRRLGVAADNREIIAGYKRYVDPVSREAPDVCVAFVDLVESGGAAVNGVIAPTTPAALAGLDRRERNYARVDVTAAADPAPGRVWAYVGSAEGRDRLVAGIAAGRAVAQRAYLDRIDAAFRELGPAQHAAFLASSDLDTLPVVDLDRIEVP